MSLKDLVNKNKTQQTALKNVAQKNINNFETNLESTNYVTELNKKNEAHLLDVDYSDPSKFARFGLARKYYEGLSTKISDYYPYDGSKYEQLKFENELNPLEKYIFNYEYPRSTGYVEFGKTWAGTSNKVDIFGSSSSPEYIKFYNQTKNNIYDPVNLRRENTRFIPASGSTIEFWLKKNSFPNSSTETLGECIFYTKTSDSSKLLMIYLDGTSTGSFAIHYRYSNLTSSLTLNIPTTLNTIADSTWHHHAFVFGTSSNKINVDYYLDGSYKNSKTSSVSTTIDITGSALCTIGALGGKITEISADLTGYGKLSGSIDEFRFWNTKRDAKQIGLNYFTNVGGGANTDDSNVNLGVYYKFNEGICESNNIDTVVLDYSGHLCNGTFVGYKSSSSRSTGSAINSATENLEVGAPIIYKQNPRVQQFLTNKLILADSHDFKNMFNLKSSMPSWIIEDDYQNGETLINFLQILASYLDTAYLQTEKIINVKNKSYLQYSGSEPSFNNLLLTSNGFEISPIFLNFDELNVVNNQNNKKQFSTTINDLKNIIYKNIYNNLDIIYKSKGTEKSFKNLIKCFGADEDLYKLNIYSDGTTYQLTDTYLNKSIKKDVIDQTSYKYSQNASSVIFMTSSADSNVSSFITGTTAISAAMCFENNFYFSSKPQNKYESIAEQSTLKTFSLFGIQGAENTQNSTTFPASNNASINIRYKERNNKAYFELTSSALAVVLTSSYFDEFYNNNLWNVSVQLYQNQFGTTPAYLLKFSGYSFLNDNNFKSFELTSSISNARGSAFFSANKRIYVGAERNNITGTINYNSNHKIASSRVWMDKLDSDELKEHAKNSNNYGRKNPTKNSNIGNTIYIPTAETLILHWDYSKITSSNSNGKILYIDDLTSGSSSNLYTSGLLSGSKSKIYPGSGYDFEPSITIKSKELIYGQEQQDPENVISSNLINILETNDDYYTKQARPEKYFFAIETSMYDIISKNVLNFFGSILEFNNLIGDGVSEYRFQYKDLDVLKRIFFSKVQNTIDLDKYVAIYKWLDDALDSVLYNLIPASANSSEKARTVIENHILHRNKVKKQIYPKGFVQYVFDPNTGAVGDASIYSAEAPKDNNATAKLGIKLGGSPMKK